MEAPAPPPESAQETYLQKVSHVQMGMAPKNLEEGLRLAQILAKSTLVPKEFQNNPGNVLIAIQMGIEIGLAPMQALQSIAVINGKPSLYGDGMLAVCMNSPLCESIKEPPVAAGVATCIVKRRGQDPIQRTFSEEQAKKAGLWGKAGPWQQYPDRMLQMRARAFALRDAFPDVLRGLSMAEEQLDVVEVEPPAKVDPIEQIRQKLNPTDEQWTFILKAWEELKVPMAGRLTHGARFANNADGLIEMLVSMGATLLPASLAAPKPKRRRRAAPTPSHADPVETAVAEVEARPPEVRPRTDCVHGVDILEPCAQCKAESDAIDAEAAAQTTTVGKPDDKQLPF